MAKAVKPTKAQPQPKPVGRPRIELTAEQGNIFGYFRATYETMACLLYTSDAADE